MKHPLSDVLSNETKDDDAKTYFQSLALYSMLAVGIDPWIDTFKEEPLALLRLTTVHPLMSQFWQSKPDLWRVLLEHYLTRHTDPDYVKSYAFYMVQHHRFFEYGYNMKRYIQQSILPMRTPEDIYSHMAYVFELNKDIAMSRSPTTAPISTSSYYTRLVELYHRANLKSPALYEVNEADDHHTYDCWCLFLPYIRMTETTVKQFDALIRFYHFFRQLPGYAHSTFSLLVGHRSIFHDMAYVLDQFIFKSDEPLQQLHVPERRRIYKRNTMVDHTPYTLPCDTFAALHTEWEALGLLLQEVTREMDQIHEQESEIAEQYIKNKGDDSSFPYPGLVDYFKSLVDRPHLDMAPYFARLYDPVNGLYNTSEKQKRLLWSELRKPHLPDI